MKMKKIILLATSLLCAGTLLAADINKDSIQETVKIQNVKHGKIVTQDVYILKSTSQVQKTSAIPLIQYAYTDGRTFTSKSKIMIKFKNDSMNISDIESKYNLKLQRKMNSGDYLFQNLNADTLKVINTLLDGEAIHIKNITPDVILNVEAM